MDFENRAKALLTDLYGEPDGLVALGRILDVVAQYGGVSERPRPAYFSQEDVVLITYADSLVGRGEKSLQTFKTFAAAHFSETFSHVHFLPFFPFSSDDGFAVTDFYAIREDLGDWTDVAAIGRQFGLMFDYVLNHISSQSQWFLKYLAGEKGHDALAIDVDPACDLSAVVRPRALPLLTPFQKKDGATVHLWTTFSEDQIDLNYRSIDVLVRMVDVLLFYLSKGASLIRMDAVAYLWKQIGTPCIHLRQTHLVVKLLRCVMDAVTPEALIITETNVPHEENISYFGDGGDEAQMVYNFSLPPLLLHAFLNGDASVLSRWAGTLCTPTPDTTFFNFTASHDGVGVRPLEGILPASAVDQLVAHVKRRQGRVSTKRNADGTESPYELNIAYVDAFRFDDDEDDALHAARFLAAQAIALVLPGVPAVYIHSILGSRNWQEGVALTGRARSINRERLDAGEIADALKKTRMVSGLVYITRSAG
jgi:glycosidase